MKNTFINKVAAERAVLLVVNAHSPGPRQLAGLSWVAIDSWQRNNRPIATQALVDELRAVSDLCQRLSDRSHETFDALDPSTAEMIDFCMQSLKQLLVGDVSKATKELA